MYNISGIDQLNARVLELQQQQALEWKKMKGALNMQYDRLNPANFIQNAFSGLADSLDPDSDILQDGAAVVSGMVVNSIMSGYKNKPLKKWLTLVLFTAVSYVLSKHKEEILEGGHKLMAYITDKLKAYRDRKENHPSGGEEEE
jgi:hypothetical protein